MVIAINRLFEVAVAVSLPRPQGDPEASGNQRLGPALLPS